MQISIQNYSNGGETVVNRNQPVAKLSFFFFSLLLFFSSQSLLLASPCFLFPIVLHREDFRHLLSESRGKICESGWSSYWVVLLLVARGENYEDTPGARVSWPNDQYFPRFPRFSACDIMDPSCKPRSEKGSHKMQIARQLLERRLEPAFSVRPDLWRIRGRRRMFEAGTHGEGLQKTSASLLPPVVAPALSQGKGVILSTKEAFVCPQNKRAWSRRSFLQASSAPQRSQHASASAAAHPRSPPQASRALHSFPFSTFVHLSSSFFLSFFHSSFLLAPQTILLLKQWSLRCRPWTLPMCR